MSSSVERTSFCSHPKISVLTPTIEGREQFLQENKASVAAQTFREIEHLILLDDERVGCAATMNMLAGSAVGDYLFILADDDLMLPRCLEIHMQGWPAEIVYAPPLVWGEDGAQFRAGVPNIPATALISREFWNTLGGYNTELSHTEDRDFWCKAETRPITWRRMSDEPTWVYRLGHGGNKSRSH